MQFKIAHQCGRETPPCIFAETPFFRVRKIVRQPLNIVVFQLKLVTRPHELFRKRTQGCDSKSLDDGLVGWRVRSK